MLKPEMGAHIYVKRSHWTHHGIYLDDNNVIHLRKFGGVQKTSLFGFYYSLLDFLTPKNISDFYIPPDKRHLDNLRQKDALRGAETAEILVRLGNYAASLFE